MKDLEDQTGWGAAEPSPEPTATNGSANPHFSCGMMRTGGILV